MNLSIKISTLGLFVLLFISRTTSGEEDLSDTAEIEGRQLTMAPMCPVGYVLCRSVTNPITFGSVTCCPTRYGRAVGYYGGYYGGFRPGFGGFGGFRPGFGGGFGGFGGFRPGFGGFGGFRPGFGGFGFGR